MSLTKLLLGFAPVAVLFLLLGWFSARRRPTGPVSLVLIAEAFVVTLFAALWFGSLGHGGWLLVFLLVGLLVAGADRGLRSALLRSPAGPELRQVGLGVLKYLAAGALLAWRLG